MTAILNTPEAWTQRARDEDTSWDAAGWSEEGQRVRFWAVRTKLRVAAGESVLDYGCGTGRFRDFLPDTIRYYALDWSEGMRERCADEHPDARIREELDPGERFDHIVAIGTFNLPGSHNATFVEIQKLWERARQSLVVSLYRGTDDRCLIYDPAEITSWAARLARRWHVDGSHRDNDLLLCLYR